MKGLLLVIATLASAPLSARVAAPGENNPAIPIVQVPLVGAADGVDPDGPPFLGVIQFDVDQTGFVRQVQFIGPAPADSGRILSRARRWIWRPATSSSADPIPWRTEFRVRSAPGAMEISRPDSILGQVLEAASFAKMGILDAHGKGREREINPLQLAHVFAGWLSEPNAYKGADPWRTHRRPRFDAYMIFDGPAGTLRADFARDAAWMRVATKERILFVPYGPIRRRIDEAFTRLLPDSSVGARMPP